MKVFEITEERENAVRDPQYDEKVQGHPILEIDLEKYEEDQLRNMTFLVIRKNEKWLREQRIGKMIIKDPP